MQDCKFDQICNPWTSPDIFLWWKQTFRTLLLSSGLDGTNKSRILIFNVSQTLNLFHSRILSFASSCPCLNVLNPGIEQRQMLWHWVSRKAEQLWSPDTRGAEKMKLRRMTRNKSGNYKQKEEMLVVLFPLQLVGMIRNIYTGTKRFKGKTSQYKKLWEEFKESMEGNDPCSDHFYKNSLNGMKLISECLLLVSPLSTMQD